MLHLHSCSLHAQDGSQAAAGFAPAVAPALHQLGSVQPADAQPPGLPLQAFLDMKQLMAHLEGILRQCRELCALVQVRHPGTGWRAAPHGMGGGAGVL